MVILYALRSSSLSLNDTALISYRYRLVSPRLSYRTLVSKKGVQASAAMRLEWSLGSVGALSPLEDKGLDLDTHTVRAVTEKRTIWASIPQYLLTRWPEVLNLIPLKSIRDMCTHVVRIYSSNYDVKGDISPVFCQHLE